MTMTADDRRITLVTRCITTPDRDWDGSRTSASRVIFLEAFPALCYALSTGVHDMQLDIERVVIDRCCTASEFLELLAALPVGFNGDVMMVRPDDSAFLSSNGRAGDRVLYSLSPNDVRFYFEMNALVTGRLLIEKTA